MSGTAEDVLRIARSQIGVTSGRKYFEEMGDAWWGQAYCARFGRWVYWKADVDCHWPYDVAFDERDVPQRYRVDKHDLRPADALSFDWMDSEGYRDGKGDHFGIVESVQDWGCVTIEGNTNGGKVDRQYREWDCIICGIRPTFATAKPEWIQADDGRWWYRHADDTYTTSGWELIDGEWYYFDAAGWMYVGWLDYKGHWYYLSGWHDGLYGHMVKDGIFADAKTGKCYAFDEEGRMLTKGGSFKVDASGALHI